MTIVPEIRSSWRRLWRRPAASLAAIATIAVAVGAGVAVFALVDALWLRPLRFTQPQRLVTLWDIDPSGSTQRSNMGWQTFADLRERSRSIESAAALSYWAPSWIEAGDVESLRGTRTSPEFFSLLGVRPAAGRFFEPQDDVRGSHRVVVLAHDLWMRRFGGDPAAVGRPISLGGFEYRVIGVLPADFDDVFSLDGAAPSEIWAPLSYNPTLPFACRTCRHLRVVARLRPGVELPAARREIDTVARTLASENPQEYGSPGVIVDGLEESVLGPSRPLIAGLAIAVALLGAMAVANLTGVGLAGAVGREGEFAVRGALGARGLDLARLPILDGTCFALLGAASGVFLGAAILRAAKVLAPAYLPRFDAAAVGGRAIAVAFGLACLAAWTASLAAAWAAANVARGPAAGGARQTASHGARRQLALVITADIAIGFVLLGLAGLMAKSLVVLLAQSPGFRSENLLTLQLTATGQTAQDEARLRVFHRQALERLVALPGVEAAALASQLPLSGNLDGYGVHPDTGANSNPELDPSGDRYSVSAGYRATMGVPLLAGRFVEESDTAAAPPVAVLSAALARRLFPNSGPEGAVGHGVKIGGTDGPWRTVVGVVGDVRHQSLEATSTGAIYLPYEQFGGDTSLSVVLRSSADSAALADTARTALRRLGADAGVSGVATYETMTTRSVAARRFSAILLGGFAAVALCLVMVGVYGVVALAAGERRREMGIRRALGANGVELGRALLGRIGLLAALGLAAGVAGALVTARALRSQLYGVAPADPGALGLSAAVLLLVALAAAAGPALRSLRIDPAETLREG